MTYSHPCTDPEKRDDWFIAKDGKQYPDDEFLTDEEKIDIAELATNGYSDIGDLGLDEVIEQATLDAEEEAKRQALIRRRKAKDACYECYFRTDCLDMAMTDDTIKHGTWGGYFEEQLRVLKTERNRRRKRNDRATEEQQGS